MTGLARRGRWQLRKARRAVLDRSGGACEARIARAACTGRADHVHHVLPRSAGGGDTPEGLLAVCRRCHDWIHAHPAWARQVGLLRSRWEAQ
ncbi:MAG: HNH endonuclease [Acidimicrobiales bacterium]|nr:HNH endonuclease [Acidimicrobiales bacterium]